LVISELKQVAIQNGLKGFENIRGVYLVPQGFGELGLLTEAFKVKRNVAKQFFIDEINAIYKKLD